MGRFLAVLVFLLVNKSDKTIFNVGNVLVTVLLTKTAAKNSRYQTTQMEIENSTLQDINTIFDLYEKARDFQRRKWIQNLWPVFESSMIEAEIASQQQWKLIINGEIACVWATTFSDLKIWEGRNINPSLYIHRIATNPNFRGQNFVQKIVDWAKIYAKSNEKKFVRLDTCGRNQGLINHYGKCGFSFLGIWKLQDTEGLPQHYVGSEVCFFEIDLEA